MDCRRAAGKIRCKVHAFALVMNVLVAADDVRKSRRHAGKVTVRTGKRRILRKCKFRGFLES